MYDNHGSPSLVNVTIAGNAASSFGGLTTDYGSPSLVNCVIWGNQGTQLAAIYGQIPVSYSIIGGGYPGTGNLDADPLFVQQLSYSLAPTSLGNYRLRYNSPAIESGQNSTNLLAEDLDGMPRLVDGDDAGSPVIDMGAYEFQRYLLTLNKVGSGSLSHEPDYPAFTTHDYVVLSADPQIGWEFAGWSGNVSSSNNPLGVVLMGDLDVTGTFTPIPYLLDVTIVGSGQVQKSPHQSSYTYGDEVTLTAVPGPGWHFVGWSGDITSTDNPLQITITGDISLEAEFIYQCYLPLVVAPMAE